MLEMVLDKGSLLEIAPNYGTSVVVLPRPPAGSSSRCDRQRSLPVRRRPQSAGRREARELRRSLRHVPSSDREFRRSARDDCGCRRRAHGQCPGLGAGGLRDRADARAVVRDRNPPAVRPRRQRLCAAPGNQPALCLAIGSLGVDSFEGGIAAAYRRELDDLPEDQRAKRLQQLEVKYERLASPFLTAERFRVPDMIDPRDTRPVLCNWIEDAYRVLPEQVGPGPHDAQMIAMPVARSTSPPGASHAQPAIRGCGRPAVDQDRGWGDWSLPRMSYVIEDFLADARGAGSAELRPCAGKLLSRDPVGADVLAASDRRQGRVSARYRGLRRPSRRTKRRVENCTTI